MFYVFTYFRTSCTSSSTVRTRPKVHYSLVSRYQQSFLDNTSQHHRFSPAQHPAHDQVRMGLIVSPECISCSASLNLSAGINFISLSIGNLPSLYH